MEIKPFLVLNRSNKYFIYIIDFIDEYSFNDLPKSRYDFAILKDNNVVRLIEFDGEQHFMEIPAWGKLETTQKRDKVKNE